MSKIYQIKNTSWLADTFVFSKMEIDFTNYDKGSITSYPYIKVNPRNKIEEIGSDIRLRFSGRQIGSIIEKSSIANKQKCQVYKIIDKQLWANKVYSDKILHPQDNHIVFYDGRRGLPSKSFWFDDHYKNIPTDTKQENKYWVCEYGESGNLLARTTSTLEILMNDKYNHRHKYAIQEIGGYFVAENLSERELVEQLRFLNKKAL